MKVRVCSYQCDRCGKRSEGSDAFGPERRKVEQAGWGVEVGAPKRDLCPTCIAALVEALEHAEAGPAQTGATK